MSVAELINPVTETPKKLIPFERWLKVKILTNWLLDDARKLSSPVDLIDGFCERALNAGLPLDRAQLAIRLLHSEHSGFGCHWERGAETDHYPFAYTPGPSPAYDNSPYRLAHETEQWVELWIANTPNDAFGVVPELKEEGYVHYFCIPFRFKNGLSNGMTLATKNPKGFSKEDKAVMGLVTPALAAAAEIFALDRMLDDLLRIYVGDEPHKRILKGNVHRGEVTRVRSAVLFADMRNFTTMSLDMTAEEVTDLLNRYYDCVVPAVEERGGEVLKFIGDGVLAMFRAEAGRTGGACRLAYEAAEDALARVAARDDDGPDFSIGIALHFGKLAYGNVGSGERLDFTVIGRDVNAASRIANLCGELDRPLLMSEPFAGRLNSVDTRYLGAYPLKGIPGLQAIFEVDDEPTFD